MSSETNRPGIKVLMKAMSVLNMLGSSEAGRALSLHEIATQLDLNKSTCHHILDTLVRGGYVEKTGPGLYTIGIKVFQIGSSVYKRLNVRERAGDALVEAQRQTGETVFLYIPRADEAVCVERLDGQYASTHLLRVGSALPLHVGASPKTFLAAKTDADIERYIERFQAATAARFPLDTRQLWRDVKHVREHGYVRSAGDIEVNTHAIGAPVRDHAGDVVGAVSISWVEALSLNSEEEIRTATLHAARQVSSRMGYSSTGRIEGTYE